MANVFNYGKSKLLAGADPTTNQRFQCSLWTATSAFPIAGTHLDYATRTALEAGSGWTEATSGGISGYAVVQMGVGVVTQELDPTNRGKIQWPKASFGALGTGGTIVAAVICWQATVNTPVSGTDVPIAAYDVTDTPTNGGTIEIRWNGTDGTGDALYLT